MIAGFTVQHRWAASLHTMTWCRDHLARDVNFGRRRPGLVENPTGATVPGLGPRGSRQSHVVKGSELTPQRRHSFQMTLVISSKSHHKMGNAGPYIALQPFCQAAVWTGIASLPAAHHGSG